jgi:hypothetical protein
MKAEWLTTVRAMRDAGYLVIIWSPEELGGVNTRYIEHTAIEYVNYTIEMLKETQAQT